MRQARLRWWNLRPFGKVFWEDGLTFVAVVKYLPIDRLINDMKSRKNIDMFKSVIAAAALALSFTSATVAAEIKIVQNDALNSLAPAAQERLITAVKSGKLALD